MPPRTTSAQPTVFSLPETPAPAAAIARPAATEPHPPAPAGSLLPDLILISLVLVLALTGLIEAASHWRQQRRADRFVAELSAAAKAIVSGIQTAGTVPADTAPGTLPAFGRAHDLPLDPAFATAAGGQFQWKRTLNPENSPVAGRILVVAFPPTQPFQLSAAELREIDRRIDDGNLATGNFQTGFNGWPSLGVRTNP